jgi:hypothetical protein
MILRKHYTKQSKAKHNMPFKSNNNNNIMQNNEIVLILWQKFEFFFQNIDKKL